MKELNLSNQELKKLTEENLINLCQLNGFKIKEMKRLYLWNNKLKNINFIQKNTSLVNLKELYISNNKITDINNIKYLINLEELDIGNNKINDIKDIKYLKDLKILLMDNLKLKDETETVEILKRLSNLKELYCDNTFKTYALKHLKFELLNIKIL